MSVDDIEVIHMTALEWDQALTNSLNGLGLTWEQLTEQAKAGDFTSLKARQLWLMAGGQGPSQDEVEVERLKADVRAAYAERDEMWERKTAALQSAGRAEAELANRDLLLAKYRETVGVIVGQREEAWAAIERVRALCDDYADERGREGWRPLAVATAKVFRRALKVTDAPDREERDLHGRVHDAIASVDDEHCCDITDAVMAALNPAKSPAPAPAATS